MEKVLAVTVLNIVIAGAALYATLVLRGREKQLAKVRRQQKPNTPRR